MSSEKPKWYDRRILGLPAYSQSMGQVIVVSLACFMTTGMYNALSGLGGSGISVDVANNANVALYSVFCVWGFFAGWFCNVVGVKISLIFGGTGYCLYSGSLLYFVKHPDTTGAKVFVIFSGGYLGACAGSIWAAQGCIIMSYPPEERKGRAIMIFWSIFNLGAVIGSAVSLGNNIKNNSNYASDTMYAIFIALMGAGLIFAAMVLPGHKVWKREVGGERVVMKEYPHWKTELVSMMKILVNEPKIYLMFPMFFASNWFYTYQFNDVNAARFNIRTRSLNSLIYWASQMVGASVFGLLLDWKKFTRSTRTKIGWVIILLLCMSIWGGGLKFQLEYTRETAPNLKLLDYTDSGYIGPMFLYLFYGIFDSIFQSYIYYLLGALSNDPKKTAVYGSFYKSIQSAGAAIVWRLDYYEIPYINMFASCWALIGGALLIGAPVAFLIVADRTELDPEDEPEKRADSVSLIDSARTELQTEAGRKENV